MIKENEKWREVREKQQELRALVDANWKNEEWRLAALGESVLRTVEESQDASANLRQQADSCIETIDRYNRMIESME